MSWNTVWKLFGFGKTEAEVEAKAKAKAEKKSACPVTFTERGNINVLQEKQSKLTTEWFAVVDKAKQINQKINGVNEEVKECRERLDNISHEAKIIQTQAEKIIL